MDLITRKLLIGAVALLIIAIFNPLGFYDWLIDTLFGISISALFLSPLASLLTGERRRVIPFTLGIGFVLFLIYMHYYLNDDLIATIVFVCEWLAVFSFISVVFQLVFAEVREEITKLLKQ